MQKIKRLLDQANKELTKNSANLPTDPGPSSQSSLAQERVAERSSNYDTPGELDHVGAIAKIFSEFEFAYHNQFHKAFSDVEDLVIAKKYWLSNLESFTPRQIVAAAKQVIRTQEFLPSIASLVKACEQGLDLYGLPSPRQAYVEACGAPSPKRDFNWSHEAVYVAGKAATWFLLANEPESRAFPIFEYHYGMLCKRVINGEHLDIEPSVALPEKIERPLGKKELRERLAKLKQDLAS